MSRRAERAHEAHHGVGGDDRRADDDCGHLRDELPHMPELEWEYGYYLSLVTMALACAGLYVGFNAVLGMAVDRMTLSAKR